MTGETANIKSEAQKLGFNACGIAQVEKLDSELPRLKSWLDNGSNGEMSYLSRNVETWLNPALLLDGAKSMIVVLQSYYYKEANQQSKFRIARYALGNDYHEVIKNKLQLFIDRLKEKYPLSNFRLSVDTSPVKEKVWAQKAGLGWIGKNSLLINRSLGSFFFIGTVITDIELEVDQPVSQTCGNCRKCIDDCPTKAIADDETFHHIDPRKCMSYWTIEQRADLTQEQKKNLAENNIFYGCDLCQNVCPFNQKLKDSTEEKFKPNPDLLRLTDDDFLLLDEDGFKKLFNKSSIKRLKYKGFKRNLSSFI